MRASYLLGCTATLIMFASRSAVAQGGLSSPVITKLPNGGTRVMNPGPTAWADTNGWKLVLERTVQPPEGDPGVLQNPYSAHLASDGRLLTLDLRNPAIRLYDKDGRFLRSLGKVGDGPGEFKQPWIALILDTLFIHDPTHRRLSVMTLDGKLVREIPNPTNDAFPSYSDDRGRIAMRQSVRGNGSITAHWIWFTRDGVRQDSVRAPQRFVGKEWEYLSSEGPSGVSVPFAGEGTVHLLGNGMGVSGRTDRYELLVTRTGYDTLVLFGRTNPPLVTIPEKVRDSAFHASVDRIAAVARVAKMSDVPVTWQPWRTLQHDGAGNIWVGSRGSRPQSSRFDVFGTDGRFLGSVAAPFEVTASVTIQGDQLTVIDADSDDLPRVRVFRIVRKIQ